MLMDWRQMAGRPTVGAFQLDPWEMLNSVWSGGKQVGSEGGEARKWDGKIDFRRGWVIAAAWLLACGAECVFTTCLRRRGLTVTFFLTSAVYTTYSTSSDARG